MTTMDEVRTVLSDTLQLGQRGSDLGPSSALLGSLPEFDSMAVVTVITALEDRFGIVVDDDEINATTFETVGSLCDFIELKLNA